MTNASSAYSSLWKIQAKIMPIILVLHVTIGFVSIVQEITCQGLKHYMTLIHGTDHLHLFWVYINETPNPISIKGGVSISI